MLTKKSLQHKKCSNDHIKIHLAYSGHAMTEMGSEGGGGTIIMVVEDVT